MIQLAFHDCLKYEDGTGGCDGCLNWAGMGYIAPRALSNIQKKHPEWVGAFTKSTHTTNNKLQLSARSLELIYTVQTWPPGARTLPVSLKESGKSRADLWALATIASVEYGVETNNMVCDGIPYHENPGKQCNQAIGTSLCHVRHFKTFLGTNKTSPKL